MQQEEQRAADAMPPTGETTEQSNRRWTNRRRMAYIALFSSIMIVAYVVTFPADIDSIQGIVSTFLAGMFGIVLGYCGFATWDDVKARDSFSGRRG